MMLRQALLIVALAVLAQGKPHESAKSHSVKHSREHELTNRMGHGDHHRRDHGSSSSLSNRHNEGSTTQRAPRDKITDQHSTHHGAPSSGHHEMKKVQNPHHITEHNIDNTKDDDKNSPSVLMESEHLIHVTSRPIKTHHTKGNHHKNESNNQTTRKQLSKEWPLSTSKIQKTPKKYSAKKHGWKKTSRKNKTTKERLREKYERRAKRSKALQEVVAGKNN